MAAAHGHGSRTCGRIIPNWRNRWCGWREELPAQPKAVLMISGHWEEDCLTVMSAARPPMEYDYFGFPDFTYQIEYPAPGDPALAGRVRCMLADAGFTAGSDEGRGFDHGTFAPAFIMYPEADMPIVQLSIHEDYDPALHYEVGRALAPLRDEEILIVGSGLSYHNLGEMRNPGVAREPSIAFDAWLQDALLSADPGTRRQRLLEWGKRAVCQKRVSEGRSPDSADGGGRCGRN